MSEPAWDEYKRFLSVLDARGAVELAVVVRRVDAELGRAFTLALVHAIDIYADDRWSDGYSDGVESMSD